MNEFKLDLTQGKSTSLCEVGYSWAKQWNWRWQLSQREGPAGHGYAVRTWTSGGPHKTRKKKTLLLHIELAKEFKIYEEGKTIDHLDRDSLNNRLDNLRAATQSQQNQNRGKIEKRTSRFRGVHANCPRYSKKWQAGITVNGKYKTLGHFDDEITAGIVYDEAAYKIYGEHTHSNFMYLIR